MKNYIGLVNDHSGSMSYVSAQAIKDYNSNIESIKNAANTEQMDTVVSVVGFGTNTPRNIQRQVVVSNPHVLRPIGSWECYGKTPMYDGIGEMIDLLQSLPDAEDPNVSFLVMITTDGAENSSKKYHPNTLKKLIQQVTDTGRWSFAIRVPKGTNKTYFTSLGIPEGNIQEWDVSAKGMAVSTVQTQAAVSSYFRARSSGATSSSAFYADASNVNVAALEDISNKVSLYVVPLDKTGIEIREFILKHRMEYLKGSAFYQLTKTESKVSHTKQILVRDRATGKIFAGKEARKMIGLPDDRNARLHPGDHKNFDLFIQSESVNRKLVGGTGVIYWKEIGTAFTESDLAYLKPKEAVNPVVQLPVVPVSTTPTKSPIPVKKKAPSLKLFDTRDEARFYVRNNGGKLVDMGKGAANRWCVQ